MSQEIEAKFAVRHLQQVRERLLQSGARVRSSRALERNWRFDDRQEGLTGRGEVLRVRQDDSAYLTFKRGADGELERTELTVAVEDTGITREILQALGYEVIAVYEKYREVFVLDPVEVMLDELPFGAFVEIEGDAPSTIRAAADRLGLDWDLRVNASYLELFQRVKHERGLDMRDATFEAFAEIDDLTLGTLGLSDALVAEGPRE